MSKARKSLSELVKRAERGEDVIPNRRGRAVVVAAPAGKRLLGTARGLIREIDPDWWKPMNGDDADAFYRGDY